MKRTDLERLKAELSTHYAEKLEREQTHLSEDQRVHMCIGFEHGMGWLWKLVEQAGMPIEEDEPAPEQWVCRACRLVSPAEVWLTGERLGFGLRCPCCNHPRNADTSPPPALFSTEPAPEGGSYSNVLTLCGCGGCNLQRGHSGDHHNG